MRSRNNDIKMGDQKKWKLMNFKPYSTCACGKEPSGSINVYEFISLPNKY
jgi:hypothetical protein